jgi:hypothetical protein
MLVITFILAIVFGNLKSFLDLSLLSLAPLSYLILALFPVLLVLFRYFVRPNQM